MPLSYMYKSHHSCFVFVVFSDVDKYRSASFFEEKNGQKMVLILTFFFEAYTMWFHIIALFWTFAHFVGGGSTGNFTQGCLARIHER